MAPAKDLLREFAHRVSVRAGRNTRGQPVTRDIRIRIHPDLVEVA
jgi:hypothetical protein